MPSHKVQQTIFAYPLFSIHSTTLCILVYTDNEIVNPIIKHNGKKTINRLKLLLDIAL